MIRQKIAIYSLSTYSLSAQLACGDGGAHCHVARRAFGADGQVTISTDGRNSIGSEWVGERLGAPHLPAFDTSSVGCFLCTDPISMVRLGSRPRSELALYLEIMDRHRDWASRLVARRSLEGSVVGKVGYGSLAETHRHKLGDLVCNRSLRCLRRALTQRPGCPYQKADAHDRKLPTRRMLTRPSNYPSRHAMAPQ